jgi:hypothetical protein
MFERTIDVMATLRCVASNHDFCEVVEIFRRATDMRTTTDIPDVSYGIMSGGKAYLVQCLLE